MTINPSDRKLQEKNQSTFLEKQTVIQSQYLAGFTAACSAERGILYLISFFLT